MVTFVDGVSQREMFNRAEGIDPKVKKYIQKISESGKNGIIATGDSMTFTTKEFAEKYDAARAAWEKSHDQKKE
jgi:hydroxymethylpyrimidine pyrophosphatase-like HAD family hydrolase